jgi:cell division septation protein DedD
MMSAPTADPGFNLKHRLTGAAILAVLAVGFVALVIDEPTPRRDTASSFDSTSPASDPFTSRIIGSGGSAPERPAAVAQPMPKLEPVLEPDMRLPVLPRLNTVTRGQGAAEEPRPLIRKSVDRSVEAGTGGDLWLVRVASFSDRGNAEQALARLAGAGYTPDSAEVRVAGKSMIRVWVGPFKDRREALRVKTDIAKRLGLEGFVRKQE